MSEVQEHEQEEKRRRRFLLWFFIFLIALFLLLLFFVGFGGSSTEAPGTSNTGTLSTLPGPPPTTTPTSVAPPSSTIPLEVPALPATPADLQANAQDGAVLLSWVHDNPPGVSFVIYASLDDGPWFEAGTTSDNSFLVEGLLNGGDYNFQVATVSGDGISVMSSIASARPSTLPGPPQNLVLEVISSSEMFVSWSPPLTDGGRTVTSYNVQHSLDGVTWETLENSSGSVALLVPDLTPGVTHFFQVAAQNATGRGPFSDPASSLLATAPDVPTGFSVSNVALGLPEASLSWLAPAFDGGSPITGYALSSSVDGVTWSNTVFVTETSSSVPNLEYATTYFFAIQAVNNFGESAIVSSAAFSTPPAPLVNLELSASVAESSSPSISFEWSPSTSSNHQISFDGGETWVDVSSPFTVPADFNTSYVAVVRAQDCFEGACTDWLSSNEVSLSTGSPSAVPAAPEAVETFLSEDRSPTPSLSFTWASSSESQISFDGVEWFAASSPYSFPADFATDYSLFHRHRNCVEGNAYDDFETLCSGWTSSTTAYHSVGSPEVAPPALEEAFVSILFQPSTSPAIEWFWDLDPDLAEQEVSIDGATWVPLSEVVSSYPLPVDFDETYQLQQRHRSCIPGNDYNMEALLCSDWSFSNTAIQEVGSPVEAPLAPESSTVSVVEFPSSSPVLSFSWDLDPESTEQSYRVNDGDWVFYDLPAPGLDLAAEFDSSYSLVHRQRTCFPGNVYNNFSTVCSAWAFSEPASALVGSPVPTPDAPPSPAASLNEERSPTPTASISVTPAPSASETWFSLNSSEWAPLGADVLAPFAVTFDGTYTLEVRSRTCSTGNIYNTSSTLCGPWSAISSDTLSVGSPVPIPATPATPIVTAVEEQSSDPTLNFTWVSGTVTDLEADFGATGSWSALDPMTSEWGVFATTFATDYYLQIRSRNCTEGNDYNATATVCSPFATSNLAAVSVGSPTSTPFDPPPLVVASALEEDSTPQVSFSWNAPDADTLEYSLNGGPWEFTSPSATSFGPMSADFSTSYSLQVRSRNCNNGNAYSDGTTLCSAYSVSNIETVIVGAPLTSPAAPITAVVTSLEEPDSTPRVRFDWTSTSPSELEYSYNGGDWTSTSTSATSYGWLDASFSTTYSLRVRGRNCITGNAYNDGMTLCSDWATSNTASQPVGAPLSDPVAPAAITVTSDEVADSTPQVRFNWTATSPTELQSSFNFGAWTDVIPAAATQHGYFDANFNTTYSYQVRARNCIAGNVYNDFATLCSGYTTSNIASEYVGSPVSTPAAPAAISVTSTEEADSTPRVRFNWTATSPTELQSSFNGAAWTALSPASSTQYGYFDASFNTTYSFAVRARNCTAGNVYNDFATLCSNWSTSNTASEYVGSPVSTPAAPAAITVNATTGDIWVNFTWNNVSATEQQRSYNGGAWTATSSTAFGVNPAQYSTTYTFQVRARNCASGNAYNNGATLCSAYTTSNLRSVTTMAPPAPAGPTISSAQKWYVVGSEFNMYYVRVDFDRNGWTGDVSVQFFTGASCASGGTTIHTVTNPTTYKQVQSSSPTGYAANAQSVKVWANGVEQCSGF